MWKRLVTILADLLKLYQKLLELSEKKQKTLVAVQAAELDAITRQEEQIVIEIGKMEALRKSIIREIDVAENQGIQNMTLSQICELPIPDTEIGNLLKDINKEFNEVTKKLQAANERNTRLIEQALSFINFNVNLLTQTTVGPTYAPQGQQGQSTVNRTVFDRKV